MRMPGDLHVSDELIKHNREMHDLLAPLYEGRHGEIFNPTEQRRIHDLLLSVLRKTHNQGAPRVLDFGAGTGNLTRQFLKLGATVVAADVSEGSLGELRALTGRQSSLETIILNGRDLTGVISDSFDIVATYSVLHHVPDYLAIVDEFVRVVKPGGIIYIDHEVGPLYWDDNAEYLAYCLELAEFQKVHPENVLQRLQRLVTRRGGWRHILATVRQRGNQIVDDGDIHVYKHDHIEWSAIRERLEPFCTIVAEEDYLVCRELQDPPPVWSHWSDRCVDMRYLVACKM
jgi:ubiquinone/menaquinone biosynthesis C-methylase UbiE